MNTDQLLAGAEPSGECAIGDTTVEAGFKPLSAVTESATEGAGEPADLTAGVYWQPAVICICYQLLVILGHPHLPIGQENVVLVDKQARYQVSQFSLATLFAVQVQHALRSLKLYTKQPGVSPCMLSLLAEPAQSMLLFRDDFTSIDTSKWGFDIGDGSDYGIPGVSYCKQRH